MYENQRCIRKVTQRQSFTYGAKRNHMKKVNNKQKQVHFVCLQKNKKNVSFSSSGWSFSSIF